MGNSREREELLIKFSKSFKPLGKLIWNMSWVLLTTRSRIQTISRLQRARQIVAFRSKEEVRSYGI